MINALKRAIEAAFDPYGALTMTEITALSEAGTVPLRVMERMARLAIDVKAAQ